jgi:hypothetical protein
MNAKKVTVRRKNKPRGGRQPVKSLLAPPEVGKNQQDRLEDVVDGVMGMLRDGRLETADGTRARIREVLIQNIKKRK